MITDGQLLSQFGGNLLTQWVDNSSNNPHGIGKWGGVSQCFNGGFINLQATDYICDGAIAYLNEDGTITGVDNGIPIGQVISATKDGVATVAKNFF